MTARCPLAVRAGTVALALLVAGIAASPSAAAKQLPGVRDARYCEIIELRGAPPDATAVVWNTIGLNTCPAALWDPLDATALARELGDSAVVLNGPRHWLMDTIGGSAGATRSFHGLRMRKVATIPIRTAADLVRTPYTDRTVARSTRWHWNRGRTVFELVAPGGDVYVMQSYSQIKDPRLTLAQLPALGRRLAVPPGWRYRARRLTRPLTLTAKGTATIIQDELQNTYQLARSVRRGPRRRHTVVLDGRTATVTAATPGTVEDHGTVTGTPFGAGRLLLVGKLAAGSLTATVRLTFPRGSVIAAVTMPFSIIQGEIDFRGVARFTGGTGAYRGITSGTLQAADHNTLDGQHGTFTVRGTARY